MSRRLQVLRAVKQLIVAALPSAEVLGLVDDDSGRDSVDAGGRVVVHTGTPGEATIDLSPPWYNYEHEIPLELIVDPSAGAVGEDLIDAMAGAIGVAVRADRTLGGLVEWLDASAIVTEDYFTDGSATMRGADLILTAHYGCADPLN